MKLIKHSWAEIDLSIISERTFMDGYSTQNKNAKDMEGDAVDEDLYEIANHDDGSS